PPSPSQSCPTRRSSDLSYAMRYGEENYDTGGWLGLGMHVGAGVNLSVMQKVEKIELQNDSNASNKSTYMKYTDGDGTIHYFSKEDRKSTRLNSSHVSTS